MVASIATCLFAALASNRSRAVFPGSSNYIANFVHPYNLDLDIIPAAVTYPSIAAEVASIVKCAAQFGLKVQARSGGHSFQNYGIGGQNGSLVVDMSGIKPFFLNPQTQIATIGAGLTLKEIASNLFAKNRAMPHGTCEKIGAGGHATVGGIGPQSRMWGLMLDTILEMDVVIATGEIVKASPQLNTDLFWAMRGAASGFGIVTQFQFKTFPAPTEMVNYKYTYNAKTYSSVSQTLKIWQKFIADPSVPREFAGDFTATGQTVVVSGTYYGSKAAFDALKFISTFPKPDASSETVVTDWSKEVASYQTAAAGGAIPIPFDVRSITVTKDTLLPDTTIDAFFHYVDTVQSGALVWYMVISLAAGAINDPAPDATSYGHRDALYIMQFLAINFPSVSTTTHSFQTGLKKLLIQDVPGLATTGIYPGYVDNTLVNPQQQYWGSNLPRLERIKAALDPMDMFHNPGSPKPLSTARY